MTKQSEPLTLSSREAGRALGVTGGTIREWIAKGKLEGHRLPTGRREYRVPAEVIRQRREAAAHRQQAVAAVIDGK